MLTRLVLNELSRNVLRLIKERRVPMGLLSWDFNSGYCPICQYPTIFVRTDRDPREFYYCLRCRSIPRWRALIHVLETHFPDWRHLVIHESSPAGASSEKIRRECKNYLATHFFPGIPSGVTSNGHRSEDLARQSFADEEFDLVVTQDVFEHILEADKAFSEVARTLRPGGAHVFTIPWYYWKETLIRAVDAGGQIKHLAEPDYHGHPLDPAGSLVVREWGWDLCDFIYKHSGLDTTAIRISDKHLGIQAHFIEVFISRKHPRSPGD